jgi:hypothetical protein
MKHVFTNQLGIGAVSLLAIASCQIGTAPASFAQVPPPPPPPAAAAPEAPASNAMTTPALTGPLVANPNPITLDVLDLGKWYFTGAITGMTLFQSAAVPGNASTHVDFTNGHFMLQKNEGVLQWFAQAGAYSFPTLGTPYVHVGRITGNTFGPFPVGYAKIVPNDEFSLQVGKLPTLIGAEYAFTFQNMNIERGLLWNQEPVFSRGVQGNYTSGPLTLSVSFNDGFYSNNYNWVSGLASYALNKENTIAVVGAGNFGQSTQASFVTPVAQNNSRIFNLIYTYNAAPWTITPYFQYTDVPSNAALGITNASTYGGAVLANYNINDNINVAGRFEYIATSGSNNLLYGPGSEALSFTITPTWQNGMYFLRGDASVVSAFSTTAGLAFGKGGNTKTQGRVVLEAGVIW